MTELEDVKGRGSRETSSKETELFSTEKAHNFLERSKISQGKGYYYCLFFPITAVQLESNRVSQKNTMQASVLGEVEKKKKRSKVASFLPTLEAHFHTIVGLCSFSLVAMASERQMPCFHFKAAFPYKQNCFHLRVFSPSHSIRAAFERMCLFKNMDENSLHSSDQGRNIQFFFKNQKMQKNIF